MFATSGDILNISLAVGFLVLVIFLSILCFYLILIVRDVSKVVDDVEDVTGRVRRVVVQPLKALDFFIEKAQPFIETMLDLKANSKKKK